MPCYIFNIVSHSNLLLNTIFFTQLDAAFGIGQWHRHRAYFHKE